MTDSGNRTRWGEMATVFAVALAVRLAYLAAFRNSPFFGGLMVDAQWHDEWAWDLARGAWTPGGHAFFRAPLYPFWLGLWYWILGHDLAAIRVVQAVLGAGTAAALAGAGRRIFGGRAGLAAGLLAALYGTLVFFDGELLIPNLLLALLAWGLFFLAGRPRLRNELAAAALLGLAVAARPNALVLLPVLLVRLVLVGRRARTVLLAAGLGLLPALGLTAANAAIEGTWVFVASQGGVNFYAGNHAGAGGRAVEIPELADIVSWRQFVAESRQVAERARGRPLDSGQVSRWWFRRGVDWIGAHPAAAAELTLKKAYYLLNGFETPSNRDPYFHRPGILRALLWHAGPAAFPWGLVFPLAVAGGALALGDPRRRRWAVPLVLWFALYALSVIPFFVTGRFRLGLLPPVLLLAGYALVSGRRLLSPRAWVPAVVALGIANSNLAGAQVENPAQELIRLGNAEMRQGRREEGLRSLEAGYRRDPRSVIAANLLAEAYMRASRPADAAPLFQQAVNARPGDADLRFNLGVAFLEMEQFDEAAAAFETAVRLDSTDVGAWTDLGVAEESRRRMNRAEAAYRRALALAPGNRMAGLRLARLLGVAGRESEAVGILRRGLDRDPGLTDFRIALALAYADAGSLGAARAEADTVLMRHPGNRTAQELLRRIEAAGEGK